MTWLDELADAEGEPLLQLPTSVAPDELATIGIGGLDGNTSHVQARHWKLGVGSEPPAKLPRPDNRYWWSRPAKPTEAREAYRIAPSRAATDWPELVPLKVLGATTIGRRLPLGDSSDLPWDVVGNAVHAFLAADLPELTGEQRLARAMRLLDAAEAKPLLKPASVLGCSDALARWVNDMAGRHVASGSNDRSTIATPRGKRRVEGAIDLLLDTPEGVVIIDHKTFPGAASAWTTKALEFAPQLAADRHVVAMSGRTVLGTWLHSRSAAELWSWAAGGPHSSQRQ